MNNKDHLNITSFGTDFGICTLKASQILANGSMSDTTLILLCVLIAFMDNKLTFDKIPTIIRMIKMFRMAQMITRMIIMMITAMIELATMRAPPPPLPI